MPKEPYFHSVETLALLSEDRVETAAKLLISAFTPLLDKAAPHCFLPALTKNLAEIYRTQTGILNGEPSRQPGGVLFQVALESVLIWEQARLASRGAFSEWTPIVLLLPGEQILRSAEPHRRLLEILN